MVMCAPVRRYRYHSRSGFWQSGETTCRTVDALSVWWTRTNRATTPWCDRRHTEFRGVTVVRRDGVTDHGIPRCDGKDARQVSSEVRTPTRCCNTAPTQYCNTRGNTTRPSSLSAFLVQVLEQRLEVYSSILLCPQNCTWALRVHVVP
jgi:hypothetical protein